MTSPSQTTRPGLTRRWRVAHGCGIVGTGLAAWWGLVPLHPPDVPVAEANERGATPMERIAALDQRAFHAPIWVAPLAPVMVEQPRPPPPTPPLRLQLLAVIGSEGDYSAVLYDPETDRLIIAREGEQIAHGRTVEEITSSGIRLGGQGGTLALREGGEP